MATIKSYSDLEQSKKLAKILPLESADMFYNEEPEDETYPKDIVDTEYPMVLIERHKHILEEYGIPCWSLAALLSVLPKIHGGKPVIALDDNYITYPHMNNLYTKAESLVDACVAMIEKLNELEML